MPQVTVDEVCDSNFDRTVQFLIEWVSDGEAGAREHLADHADRGGSSLIAVRDQGVTGIVTIRARSRTSYERKPTGQEPDLCTDLCTRRSGTA